MKTRYIILLCILLVGCTSNLDNPITYKVDNLTSNVTVYFIDIGQGDSSLIVSNKVMLIDCGLAKNSKKVIDLLDRLLIQKIDYLLMTHQDADHIGGCKDILTKYDVGTIYYNGESKDTITSKDILKIAGDRLVIPNANDVIDLNGSMYIVIQRLDSGDSNHRSIVGNLVYNNTILFTGDCDGKCETELLHKDIKANVLHVTHHGSKHATSQSFIDRVDPSISIISVGKNSYGHPSDIVINRLASNNITIHRTDIEHTIII
jgi:competence protein ComEC